MEFLPFPNGMGVRWRHHVEWIRCLVGEEEALLSNPPHSHGTRCWPGVSDAQHHSTILKWTRKTYLLTVTSIAVLAIVVHFRFLALLTYGCHEARSTLVLHFVLCPAFFRFFGFTRMFILYCCLCCFELGQCRLFPQSLLSILLLPLPLLLSRKNLLHGS